MRNFIDAYSWVNLRFLLEGLGVTIEVSTISIVSSFIIGSILGVVNYAKIKYLSVVVSFMVDIIRNLPLILIIFFTYFGLPHLGFKPEIVFAAVLALTIFESAMLAEIIRSGILAIDYGQMEGARANGMSYVQALWYIIFPQAIKKTIPTIVSQFISLIKDTSLATIIVLPELLNHAQIIYGQNAAFILPMFLIISVMYFIVCYVLSVLSQFLDRKLA
ncbi:amino acid ABC transporter permease [Lactiplantibacillus paraplantarum]|uniref:amino acid ABC transporter permease n=1 Tax=Lactiplantibacillus paraplantarum TaxID=60520 RepID=UPI0005133503|nr:amino acid ABC transporter permease [Lactiplantibacillus paraplantarum]ALO03407.1 glutamine ABC transporter permease [Lactiplantibacillus paraplantarum]KGE76614.1 glutamine ABC transporter permease [Lactiplantibacillus paraplantarum]OAX76464.1 glutamine ABC transporter permease [Lactiplantibacillus plantarum]RDG12458.1 amino acid ABC transporter permease [Lactiplantibacillus paraplantarum]